MSYNIELTDPHTGECIELSEPHQMIGTTYQVGGTKYACLGVTYNYALHFNRVLGTEGIRLIYGMTGKDSIPFLESAILCLKNDVCEDYWAPTEGNAKRALQNLVALAKLAPHGVWKGD